MPYPAQSGFEATTHRLARARPPPTPAPLIQTAAEAREHAIRVAIEASQQTSPFLFIAPEIRNMILKWALPSTYTDENGENVWQLGGTSLLRTCRQLHAEGTSILYANPFNFTLDTAISDTIYIRYIHSMYKSGKEWSILKKKVSLANMAPRNVALMRHWIMDIVGWGYSPHHSYWWLKREVDFIWWFAEHVEEALKGPLQQIKGVKKVTVKWKGECPGSEIVKLRYRAWILLPFELNRVAIEEDTSVVYGGR